MPLRMLVKRAFLNGIFLSIRRLLGGCFPYVLQRNQKSAFYFSVNFIF